VARNNNELVATWGNLANRVLTFAYKNWEGRTPDPGDLRPQDVEILAKVDAGFNTVGDLLETVKLRAALAEAVSIASEVNRYLDAQGPWFEIKQDKAEAAKTIFTALKAIDSLTILFAPFLPFSAEKLHTYFGHDGTPPSPTTPPTQWAAGNPANCNPASHCAHPVRCLRNWKRRWWRKSGQD
jgi:methionyl-tRNA synthetase